MSENPQNHDQGDSGQGQACGTSGSACRPCSSGRLLLVLLAAVALAYILTSRSVGPAAPSAVAWLTDHDHALNLASEQNQPVLVVFKADWCRPCKIMDNQVFAKQAAANALSGWVPVKVDVDEHGKLASQYNVSGIPAMVAVSPDGAEIGRATGALSMQQFAEFLASTEARMSAATTATAE